ncbi:GNAT family N-acetyltransferase [Peribacillus sp. NPDC097295]|uniref:GNAT family N-acetyltransferase n=1 Tax=Peribacillus sp. NPDC097295 TaxID=3364402 RepID=UPI00382C313B
MFPVLETDRLILREIIESDTEEIFRCFSNDELTRFYGQDSFESLEQARGIIETFAQNYKEKRAIRWGIERKESPGLIGTIGFHAYMPKNKRAEIGYEIHPEHWHKGYMTEALNKIKAFGFDDLGLTRIGAVVFVENEPSSALLKKAGFAEEGILRKYMYQNGIPHDTYMYSLIK